jgi:hypothetical protein
MKMHEVRQIAKKWGIDIKVGRSKQDIIRDIQVKEGYSPCYRTKEECEYDCLWKPDCLMPEINKSKALRIKKPQSKKTAR